MSPLRSILLLSSFLAFGVVAQANSGTPSRMDTESSANFQFSAGVKEVVNLRLEQLRLEKGSFIHPSLALFDLFKETKSYEKLVAQFGLNDSIDIFNDLIHTIDANSRQLESDSYLVSEVSKEICHGWIEDYFTDQKYRKECASKIQNSLADDGVVFTQ